MNDLDASLAAVARRAAARLADDFGPDLPATVEVSLSGAPRKRGFNLDPNLAISIAGVLLSALQFGLQEYRQIVQGRRDRESARGELVASLRRDLGLPAHLTPEQRDRIAAILADEIVATGDPGPAPGSGLRGATRGG
jgi:hypothetical protein